MFTSTVWMKSGGIRSGTKAKRPHSVILGGSRKVALVRWLRFTCVATDPLTGWKQAQTVHSLPQLRRCLVTWCSAGGRTHYGAVRHHRHYWMRCRYCDDGFSVMAPMVEPLWEHLGVRVDAESRRVVEKIRLSVDMVRLLPANFGAVERVYGQASSSGLGPFAAACCSRYSAFLDSP